MFWELPCELRRKWKCRIKRNNMKTAIRYRNTTPLGKKERGTEALSANQILWEEAKMFKVFQ
jgi:hypothetical protein